MKNNVFVKMWDILYPILIYYVVSNVVMYLAMLALGISGQAFVTDYMMLQTIATAVALPVLYNFYRRDQQMFTVFHQRTRNEFSEVPAKRKILHGVLTFVCGALAGIFLNNMLGATGLAEFSEGYQNITTHFFAGSVLFEILGAGLLIPLVEELLYRGIVYARLSDWVGISGAAMASALMFGSLHFNLVQLIYAFFLGLLLVFFLEKTHNLYGAVLGHMGANLMTVLRVETGVLDWMGKNKLVFWGSTAVLAAVCLILLFVLCGKWSKKTGS